MGKRKPGGGRPPRYRYGAGCENVEDVVLVAVLVLMFGGYVAANAYGVLVTYGVLVP